MTERAPTREPSRPYRPPDDSRLPRFSSYQEEAAFWETHDFETLEPLSAEELAERRSVEDEWRSERVGQASPRASLTVDLDAATYDALVSEAETLGVEPEALARSWLRERLRSAYSALQNPMVEA